MVLSNEIYSYLQILVKQKKSQLHVDIELIDSEEDQEEVAELADTAKWSDYVEKYVGELQVRPCSNASGLLVFTIYAPRPSWQ